MAYRNTKALAAALVAVTLIAGCGSDKQEQTPSPSDSNKGATNQTYKISWVSSQTSPVDKDAEMVKYWNEKFNVDLDVWNVESKNYDEVLNLKFASGETPDKLLVRTFANLQKYVQQDILAEIPLDLLKKNAPNLYEKIEKEYPGAYNYAKVDGKIYGIPGLNVNNRFREPVVWRGDWLKNVGIAKAPETLAEFEQTLYKFANEDPDRNGKKDTYGLSQSALTMIYGAFGFQPNSWNERNGKLVYGGVQPEMKQALALLGKWYKDGVLDPEFVTGENSGGVTAISHAFVNGRIGLSAQGSYFYYWKPLLYEGDATSDNYLEMRKVNPAAADAFVYGLPPKGPGGTMGAKQGNVLTGSFISFGKQLEKQPEKLARILQMMDFMNASTYENHLLTVYGPQGKYWDFDANHLPGPKNNMKKADYEKIGASLIFLNIELPEFILQRDKIRLDWAKEKQFDKGGLPNALNTSLPSQAKYQTELQKVQDQAYLSIITGDKPLDSFDDFVKKWRGGGGEQMEKEAADWWASLKK